MLLFSWCILCCCDMFVVCVFVYLCGYAFFFFFKQKTAYEMRISDWSSDVCSSDLSLQVLQPLFHCAPTAYYCRQTIDVNHPIVHFRRRQLGCLVPQRAERRGKRDRHLHRCDRLCVECTCKPFVAIARQARDLDRKSTRLNSSH